jgi:hypothetical protein
VPLDATHVEPVQKALDVMDVRLHRDLGKAPVFGTRVLSALLVIAILWTGEIGVLIVPAILAVFRPTTAALAALGTMASFSAVLELANRFSLSGAEPPPAHSWRARNGGRMDGLASRASREEARRSRIDRGHTWEWSRPHRSCSAHRRR